MGYFPDIKGRHGGVRKKEVTPRHGYNFLNDPASFRNRPRTLGPAQFNEFYRPCPQVFPTLRIFCGGRAPPIECSSLSATVSGAIQTNLACRSDRAYAAFQLSITGSTLDRVFEGSPGILRD